MRGLLPRSLLSPIPYKPDLSSGWSLLLFCGDLRRLSPGRLCCSSRRSLAKSGCSGKFSVGGCVPPGAGVGGPIIFAPPPPPPMPKARYAPMRACRHRNAAASFSNSSLQRSPPSSTHHPPGRRARAVGAVLLGKSQKMRKQKTMTNGEAPALCPGQVQVIEGSYWERQI